MSISDLIPWREREKQMPIRRERDPFLAMRQEFDRLMSDFSSLTPWSTFESVGDFTPSIDVTELEDRIEVTAELPGLSYEDIDLTLSGETLTIKGEKKQEHEVENGNYYRMERRYGSFCRTIPMSADLVDADKADATFKDGILTVILPKREESKQITKRIKVAKN